MADLSTCTRLEVREAPASYRVMLDSLHVRPGYKQTEVGVIPEDWDSIALVHLSAFITKGSTPTTYGFKWEPSGVLFLRSECVSEDGLNLAKSMFISPAAHATLRRSEACDGDILVTITGNVGRVVRLVGVSNANLNQHIARVRITAPNADSQYVYHYLSQPSIRRRFNSITTGQAYLQISLKQVREAEVALPALLEQRAIATALSDVDALIASLDKLIAKKRDLKQAAMQQLLTGQRRLPGFSGEWEVKRLGDVLHVRHGKSQHHIAVNDGQYPILATGGEIGRTNIYLYDKPSVLIGRKGTIDKPQYQDEPFWTVDTLFYTELSNAAHPKFIFFKFLMIDWRSYNEASGVPSLNASTIESIEIAIPKYDEQTAIAAALSDMDAEIAALEARRDKTRALKLGMMQELLTGRIRLV